jgi:hypothetical protein
LRAITQSPRPSRCHLSMSCCSGGQTVESPSRRRRRPLARNTRTIYRAKWFKCGWDCLFLNKSAPYASIHPLLYTLIVLPSSQPRSKRESDFKFVSGRPMERLEVEFEAYAQSHSYDSPLVSQPSMSSSSSSSQLRPTLGLLTPSLDFSNVEPVARPWRDVYSERSTVERNWRRGRYSVRTLRGHTDGVSCLQFSETLQHPSFRILITCGPCGTLRLASKCAACADICVLCGCYSSTRPS